MKRCIKCNTSDAIATDFLCITCKNEIDEKQIIGEGKLSKIMSIFDGKEVLVYKTYDDEDDKYKIVFVAGDDLNNHFKLGYESEEDRDKAWDEKITIESCERVFESAKNMIRS